MKKLTSLAVALLLAAVVSPVSAAPRGECVNYPNPVADGQPFTSTGTGLEPGRSYDVGLAVQSNQFIADWVTVTADASGSADANLTARAFAEYVRWWPTQGARIVAQCELTVT